jgi:hypothetical protein
MAPVGFVPLRRRRRVGKRLQLSGTVRYRRRRRRRQAEQTPLSSGRSLAPRQDPATIQSGPDVIFFFVVMRPRSLPVAVAGSGAAAPTRQRWGLSHSWQNGHQQRLIGWWQCLAFVVAILSRHLSVRMTVGYVPGVPGRSSFSGTLLAEGRTSDVQVDRSRCRGSKTKPFSRLPIPTGEGSRPKPHASLLAADRSFSMPGAALLVHSSASTNDRILGEARLGEAQPNAFRRLRLLGRHMPEERTAPRRVAHAQSRARRLREIRAAL